MKIKKIVAFILGLLILQSCTANLKKEEYLKLYVFDCGDISVSDISLFSPGHDKGVRKDLNNACYLIDHPKGKMIWDTGLPDALSKAKNGVTNGPFTLKVKNPLEAQLAKVNISPEQIDFIALSHFHFDHSGNANLFKSSKLLIQKEEYDAIYSKDAKRFGFDPSHYNQLSKDNAVVLKGDHDVFGDGKVVILRTPGHTPGHQSLLVKLKNKGVVLSGDLYHFEKNRKHKRVPSFNHSHDETVHSMNKMEDFLKDKGYEFWIQHDPKQYHSMKLAPNYYQ